MLGSVTVGGGVGGGVGGLVTGCVVHPTPTRRQHQSAFLFDHTSRVVQSYKSVLPENSQSNKGSSNNKPKQDPETMMQVKSLLRVKSPP